MTANTAMAITVPGVGVRMNAPKVAMYMPRMISGKWATVTDVAARWSEYSVVPGTEGSRRWAMSQMARVSAIHP